jgi:antitoxin FitA
MAQVLIRNIEEDVKTLLKQRAMRHGQSMEEEVRQILRDAVMSGTPLPIKLGSRIAERFSCIGLESDLPEMHGEPGYPMDFES